MGRRGYSVPAVKFPMGPFLQCFQTTVRVAEVTQLLGHDPRSRSWGNLAKSDQKTAEMYGTIQRKSPKDRVDDLENYIQMRLRTHPQPRTIGALPAISIAFEFAPMEFDTVDGGDGELGYLVLPPGRRILLDGLQRVTAALDYYQEHPEVNDWFVFAATFYFPSKAKGKLGDKELGQLFFDMNYKQRAISTAHAMKLDQADLYLSLISEWNQSGIIHELGGVEDAASLGKKSTAFVVRKHLYKFVRGALEGRKVQDQDKFQPESPRLTDDNYEQWSRDLQQYLRELRTRMGKDGNGRDKFADKTSVHVSSGGWQVLGLAFHDLYVTLGTTLSASEKSAILDRLAGIDWSRYNQKWIDLLGEGEIEEETGKMRLVKSTRWGTKVKNELLAYVREQAGIAQHLPTSATDEYEPAGEPDDSENSVLVETT